MKQKWKCSYAYDTPSYVDFVVEAETEEEALKQSKAALEAGVFGDEPGVMDYNNTGNDRVFVSSPVKPGEQLDDRELKDGKLV